MSLQGKRCDFKSTVFTRDLGSNPDALILKTFQYALYLSKMIVRMAGLSYIDDSDLICVRYWCTVSKTEHVSVSWVRNE